MAFAIGITAIVVGIIAYGVGKLSVYVRQDNERDPTLPQDPSQAWDARQFDLWNTVQTNGVTAERALAKQVSTLSLAGLAGAVTLAELAIINTLGLTILMAGFLLAVLCCIANLQARQSWFDKRARQLQEAFEQGHPVRRLSYLARRHTYATVLSIFGTIFFGTALVLTMLAVAGSSADCRAMHDDDGITRLYCGEFIQAFVREDS